MSITLMLTVQNLVQYLPAIQIVDFCHPPKIVMGQSKLKGFFQKVAKLIKTEHGWNNYIYILVAT